MRELISSPNNVKFKFWESLFSKSRERKKHKKAIVEGHNEIKLAIKNGHIPECFLLREDGPDESELKQALNLDNEIKCFYLTPSLFKQLSYREDSQQWIGVFNYHELTLEEIKLPTNCNILVLEGIEKPGNLGAIIRSAEASGTHLVLLVKGGVDPFHPNAIRNSVGCVFSQPIAIDSAENIIDFLLSHKIAIYTTFMEKATSIYATDFSKSSAVILGTEATGLTQIWRKPTFTNINIPMEGTVDSLNVSTAAAIIQFERLRQSLSKA